MISSMTSFGRIEDSIESGHVIWEIRSVNHRYLEINLRLPDDFRQLENKIRQSIANKFKRGKVDCQLRFEASDATETELSLNTDLAKKVLNACEDIKHIQSGTLGTVNPIDVLRWPGIVERKEFDMDSVSKELMGLLNNTLDDAIESRQTEGEKLQALIQERCDSALTIVRDIKQDIPHMLQQLREKLLLRVKELCQEVDNDRLEQELAFLAQKYDVEEELDRLQAHISEVESVIQKSGPVGRRLDFLMQEMNREANTLGSKATDIQHTNASVELKVLIEQMREQIQNIE